MSSERPYPPESSPESYLRRFAEAQLRRLASGEAAAADCASRVDAVAAAFEGTGALDGERAAAVTDDLDVALAARSPERGTPLHEGRRAQFSPLRGATGFARIFARTAGRPGLAGRGGEAQLRVRGTGHGQDAGEVPGEVVVVPAEAVLRMRDDGGHEDVYLLSYVTAPGRAWLSVAARTTAPRVRPRPASPPSARNPRTASPAGPMVGGLTAVDDAGREYHLGFSGGGGDHWYLGRLSVYPVPPRGIAWLEVRGGGRSVRLDLTAAAPPPDVRVRTVAASPGEAYLLRCAEGLLGKTGAPGALAGSTATAVTELASVVPALRAVGLLPDGSPVPGQLAALAERLGAPGRLIAEPGELPERWAGVLDAGLPEGAPGADAPGADGTGAAAAARLAAVLPETGGMAVQLTGMVTLPGQGTVIFGGLRLRAEGSGQSLWLRDDAGRWHAVSIRGWSSDESSYTFQAAVVPPVGPETSRVEFYVTGADAEVRAGIPLTWWHT